MEKISEQIRAIVKGQTSALCLATAIVVFMADYFTGTLIRFPIFYVLPVIMASWLNRRSVAYMLSVVLPVLRMGIYRPHPMADPFWVLLINTLIKIAALSLVAYLVDRTASQARRLKTLEGILPICASCKRIRNNKGEYEQMEAYISDHSEASFSHGLCPECTRRLYPDIYEQMKGTEGKKPGYSIQK